MDGFCGDLFQNPIAQYLDFTGPVEAIRRIIRDLASVSYHIFNQASYRFMEELPSPAAT
jgi:hypothetical protein